MAADSQGDPQYLQMIKDALNARAEARQRNPHRGRRISIVSRPSTATEDPEDSTAHEDSDSELARAMASSPVKSRKVSSAKSMAGKTSRLPSRVSSVESTAKRVTIQELPRENAEKTIDLSCQGLTSVQTSLFSIPPGDAMDKVKDITILDLSGNNLRMLPPDVGRLRSLVRLDLSRNGIRCLHSNDYTGLPQEMAQLTRIQVLNISECNLPFLPPVIWKLTSLRELDISRNKINILVPEVGNLISLRYLNAQQTNLSTLPAEIAFCQNLEDLLLWGNVIDSLPETLKELPRLHRLAINYRSFCAMVDAYMENLLRKGQIQSEHIPPVLFEMPCLDSLDLESTKINTLPDGCKCRLQELYINNNFFIKAPLVVFKIKTLHTLDISDNLITLLPGDIGGLSSLKILRSNNNSFDYIPEQIGQLSNLQVLAMGGNRLKQIPNEIGNLVNLKTLVLNRNEIQTIPERIMELVNLETLDLTSNEIKALPVQFFHMKRLRAAHTYQKFHKYGLWLHKNPLTTPPPEVWKTDDPENIYRYLRKLQIKQTENLQRQKLILLGETGSGKTSLVKAMMTGKASPEISLEDTTKLIEHTLWRTENNVQFLVIDMGGQPIYHSMQPMFFDDKALYLVVYDHRNYSVKRHHESIGQWLELIMLYAPGSVVKVIGTKCDLCYPDIAEANRQMVKEQIEAQLQNNQGKLRAQMALIDAKCATMKQTQNIWYQLMMKQRRKMEAFVAQSLRIEHDVATVASMNGITGLLDLVNDIEMLAVNHNLFPHAQRYIPEYWKKFQHALKLQKGLYLTTKQLGELAGRHRLNNDTIQSCMEYLVDTGEIMWLPSLPNLRHVIFHNPRKLVEVLCCLFRHNMEEFLDFDNNRVFVHKSQFTRETFTEAVHEFLQNGLISRRLLHCLWFYLHLDHDQFEDLSDLIAKMDICCMVPQPELPQKRNAFIPLLVLPAYNQEHKPADVSDLWPEKHSADEIEVAVEFVFPLQYPNGLFEKFICRVQDLVYTRIDWKDFMYAEMENPHVKLTISRCLHPDTYDLMFKIITRAKTYEDHQRALVALCQNLYNLIVTSQGLIWYVRYTAEQMTKLDVVKWFPEGLFDANISEEMRSFLASRSSVNTART